MVVVYAKLHRDAEHYLLDTVGIGQATAQELQTPKVVALPQVAINVVGPRKSFIKHFYSNDQTMLWKFQTQFHRYYGIGLEARLSTSRYCSLADYRQATQQPRIAELDVQIWAC
jgi:hypothetical protein